MEMHLLSNERNTHKKSTNGCDFSEMKPVHSNNSPEKHWAQIKCKVDFTNHDQGFLCLFAFFLSSENNSCVLQLDFFCSPLVFALLFTLSLHLIHSSVYHFECVCKRACVAVSSTHSLHCANVVYISKCTSAATEDVVSVVVVVWSAIVSNLYSLMHLAKEN